MDFPWTNGSCKKFFTCCLHSPLTSFLRNPCSIPDGDTVVVTGGQYTQPEVSRYNENGFIESLPNLLTGRWTHSCSWFINDDRKMVYIFHKSLIRFGECIL